MCYLRQTVFIRHGHAATIELHDALTGEVFQQAAHHLAGRTHVLCHLVLGQADIVAAGLGKLVRKEDGQPRSALMKRICCIVHMVSEKRSAVI